MRFSKLYELFLAEKELLKGKSSGDLRNHQNMGKSFLLPALGTKKVENITLGDWQNIINTAFQKSQARSMLRFPPCSVRWSALSFRKPPTSSVN